MTVPPVRVQFTVEGVDPVVAASRRVQQSLDATAKSTGRLVATTGASREGFRKFENALTNVGLGMIRLNGTVGNLAEGLLLMSAGGPVTLGIVAGLAIIGAAYELLTRKTREARKATDEFVDAQLKAAQSREDAADPSKPVARAFAGGIGIDGKETEGLTKRLERLNAELAKARRGVDVFDRATGGIKTVVDQGKVAQLEREIRQTAIAAAEVGRRFLDATKATTDNAKASDATAKAYRGVAAGAKEAEQAVRILTTAEREAAAAAAQAAAVIAAAHEATAPSAPAAGRTGGFDALIAGQQRTFTAPQITQDINGVVSGVERLEEAERGAIDATEQLGLSLRNAVANNIADFFSRGIDEAESFGDAVRELGRSIVNTIRDVVAQLLAAKIVAGVAGLFGGGLPPAPAMGQMPKFATGGLVHGPGTGTSDSIPARLSAGEFVVNAAATARNLDLLAAINAGMRPVIQRSYGVRGYASGGLVESASRVGVDLYVPEGVEAKVRGAGDVVRIIRDNKRAIKKALG